MSILTENLYPTKLELKHTINHGFAKDVMNPMKIYEVCEAVTLTIQINGSTYPKQDVYKAVKEICEKALEHFS